MPLASDVLRVQAAGYGRICRAFDDRPSIGKQGDLERVFRKLQHESVLPHPPVRRQPLAHLPKVDRACMLVDLHRVPAAQRDMWSTFPG